MLAGSRGLTLYYYTEDKPGSGKSVCTGACAKAWPPLTAPVKAPAGAKMPGPIGMITRAGGVKQVTINGYPVYYYAEDMAPGQAAGNGAGGSWHVIKIRTAAGSRGDGPGLGAEGRAHHGRDGAGRQQGADAVLLHGGQAGQRQVGCTGACAKAWPPLTAPVKAPAGAKMPGPIGMITRAGGAKQVTINGYPVYYYAEDMAPGQAAGNGAGGGGTLSRSRRAQRAPAPRGRQGTRAATATSARSGTGSAPGGWPG